MSWNRPARRIVDFVRASNLFPFRLAVPRTKRGGSTLRILKARMTGTPVDAPPGAVGTERSGGVEVAGADEWLVVSLFQLETCSKLGTHVIFRSPPRSCGLATFSKSENRTSRCFAGVSSGPI
jgi:methionyl-tRNA formyltransferase